MSFNYFCHNIALALGDCTRYEPSQTLAQLTSLRVAQVGSTLSLAGYSGRGGLLAVKDRCIWQNEPTGTGNIEQGSTMYASSDFGETWTQQITPYDENADIANIGVGTYPGAYPNQIHYNSFLFRGDELYAVLGNWSGRTMGIARTSALGVTESSWSVVGSPFWGITIRTPYYGSFGKIGEYGMAIAIGTNGEVMQAGGMAASVYVSVKEGIFDASNATSAGSNVISNSDANNDGTTPSFLATLNTYDNDGVAVNKDVYGIYQRSNGESYISMLPLTEMRSTGGVKNYDNIRWNSGTNRYTADFVGTWFNSTQPNRNDTVSQQGVVSGYASAGIQGVNENARQIIMAGSTTIGWFVKIENRGSSLQDLTSLLVNDDPAGLPNTSFSVIKYIADTGYWVLLYGFSASGSVQSPYFFMRVSKYPDNPAEWSDALKILLPENLNSPSTLYAVGGSGPSIGYSRSEKKYVFSSGIAALQDDPAYTLHTMVMDDIFECVSHEEPTALSV